MIDLAGITSEITAFREQGLDLNVEMSNATVVQLSLGLFVAMFLSLLIAGYLTK
tara:strand:+ start:8294 stop:8455 length:162 start_codon:yes stop_codon:yes gene_type:complete